MRGRVVAVLLVLGLSVAACGLLPSGPTVVTLRAPDGSYELPVALFDPDGLVAMVEAAEPDPAANEVLTTVDDDTVLLQWLGGACDARSQINVHAHDDVISVAVRTDPKPGSGCIALGIPRSVTITFREPLGNRTIELAGA